MIGPHPEFTMGIGGAAGEMTTLTILLGPQGLDPTDPAGIEPQDDARTYLAEIV